TAHESLACATPPRRPGAAPLRPPHPATVAQPTRSFGGAQAHSRLVRNFLPTAGSVHTHSTAIPPRWRPAAHLASIPSSTGTSNRLTFPSRFRQKMSLPPSTRGALGWLPSRSFGQPGSAPFSTQQYPL